MTTGVLLMAYGSPTSLDEIQPFLRDIRGGRPIRPGLLEDLTERYRRTGIPSPLLAITRAQAAALQARLGDAYRVAIGMKHWEPRIAAAIAQLAASGVARLVGVALTPHYSHISIGGYEGRARRAMLDAGATFDFEMVPHWYDEPAFIGLVARNLRAQLAGFDGARVFFTAHSLPERIIAQGDPYVDQLLASAKLIADAAGAPEWEFAFQSESATGEPWLGPGILERLDAFAAHGGRRVVVAPIGFVADHLEILHDVDIECATKAASLGLQFRRIASPNDDPMLIRALATVVRTRSGS